MKTLKNAWIASAAALALLSLASHAQTPEAMCAKLMPPEKMQAAIGKGMKLAEADVEKSGKLSCAWTRRAPDPFATLSIEYYDKKVIAASAPDNAGTPDSVFENIVAPHEQLKNKKREAIAGVGKRAAFAPGEPQQLLAVERVDAVLRIVMNGASKAQATAVAKAVAAP